MDRAQSMLLWLKRGETTFPDTLVSNLVLTFEQTLLIRLIAGCTQDDVINQTPSPYPLETAFCYETQTGASCGQDAMDYTVTFKGEDYCYGDGIHQLATPSGPFTYGWSSCCWVSMTADNGNIIGGDSMQQVAVVNDLTNNSPIFKHPPLWLIMAQCDGQYIDLAPKDVDGDVIKCRWATQDESGGAYTDPNLWPSLTLDTENCVVHYTGSLDTTSFGVKPVAITMEDFDIAGNVRSSIPVQFLAQVWTPNLKSRTIGYPDWFAVDSHDHDQQHSKKLIAQNHELVTRGRRSTPAYCTAVPYFVGDTPADGDVLNASSGQLSFTLHAESQVGTIGFFSYQGPLGLICTNVDGNGSSACTWTPTADQLAVDNHQFCFDATDSVGLLTERRCIVIETRAPIPSPGNIMECAVAVLDGPNASPGFFTSADITDYGCAGRGTFDAFVTTAGKQLDEADHAFYAWKKCYQCATGGDPSLITDYVYDIENDSCGKFSLEL